MQQRTQLRQTLRSRRQSLTQKEQQAAAHAMLEVVIREQLISNHQQVALYLANDGEIDPEPLIQWLWRQGVSCYLPVLHPEKERELLFVAYHERTPLLPNRFGINEPVVQESDTIAPEALDLVFMPLTGFTEDGERLGMGGGFYDKTFSFAQSKAKPRLIGLAHECQKVTDTYSLEWDIPMLGIVTDQRFYRSGITPKNLIQTR